MFIGIQHNITDATKWQQSVQNVMSKVEGGTLPAGMKPTLFLPSTNGKTAICVWEANSLNDVKNFVEREASSGTRNEYFQIDAEHAMGLPTAAAATR